MRLSYHPEAEAELIVAAEYYESRSSDLGDRFLRESDATIVELQAAPGRWPSVEGNLHCRTMGRFPFGIYYRVQTTSCASSSPSIIAAIPTTGVTASRTELNVMAEIIAAIFHASGASSAPINRLPSLDGFGQAQK